MSNEQDRIKLAEAMGWTHIGSVGEKFYGHNHGRIDGCFGTEPLPNPFTDANDDYAVLEWVRAKAGTPESIALGWGIELRRFLCEPGHYKIGDYARAALKALEEVGDV